MSYCKLLSRHGVYFCAVEWGQKSQLEPIETQNPESNWGYVIWVGGNTCMMAMHWSNSAVVFLTYISLLLLGMPSPSDVSHGACVKIWRRSSCAWIIGRVEDRATIPQVRQGVQFQERNSIQSSHELDWPCKLHIYWLYGESPK